MPHALELPGMLGSVVELMRRQWLSGLRRSVISEFIALAFGRLPGGHLRTAAGRLPGFAAIAGALDHLPEPAAGLRGIQPFRISRLPLQVIDFPACKKRPADSPLLAFSVRCKNEGAFARAHQH